MSCRVVAREGCLGPHAKASRPPRAAVAGLLLGAGIAMAAQSDGAPLQFTSRFTSIPVGAAPQGIAIGDVNGDGHDDVVFSHVGAKATGRDSLLHVTYGDGAGGFRQGGDFKVDALPGGVALADVDGDGKLDAVVACAGSGTLAVLRGNGDGSFAAMQRLRAGVRPIQVLGRDLDGDGRVDLAAVNMGTGEPRPGDLQAVAAGSTWSDSSSITVYLSKPARAAAKKRTSANEAPLPFGFQPPLVLAGGVQNIGIAAADVDADGRTDLIVAQRGSQTLRWWNAQAGGGFAAGGEIAVGADLSDVVAGDVDRDGALDIVALAVPKQDAVPQGAAPEDRATLVVLRAAQKFTLQTQVLHGRAPFRLQLADVNEDGNLDVVSLGRGFLWVQRGAGDGTFAASPPLWVDTGTSFALARLDGDAHVDIVSGNSRGLALTLAIGNGDGTFGSASEYTTGASPAQVLAADVTGDGRLDLVTANAGGNSISVLAGEPGGTFAAARDLAAPEAVSALASGDLDGDGDIDLVAMAVRGRASEIDVYRNNGDGSFLPRADLATGVDPAALVLADVNGDRKLDLVVPRANQLEVLVYAGRGDASFQPPQRVPVPQLPQAIAVADVDGDGKQDLVTANTRENTVTVLLGKGDATFAPAPSFRFKYDIGSLAVADVNRDGKPDLVVGPRRASATGAVLAGTGGGTFGQRSDFQVGVGCGPVVLADLDADGWLDVAAPDAASGCLVVLHGGPQGLGERADFGSGPNAVSCVVADVDGDGKLDVVVANRDTSTLTLLHNRGR